MTAILYLIPIALTLGAVFGFMFAYAVRTGQFEDLDDPPERILRD
jgi:cbb3-type cytochrome oxidase maturation protein